MSRLLKEKSITFNEWRWSETGKRKGPLSEAQGHTAQAIFAYLGPHLPCSYTFRLQAHMMFLPPGMPSADSQQVLFYIK